MEKNIIIVDNKYDRYVFVFYKDNEIVGLNFHQGLDEVLLTYNKPCPHVTEIYRRLGKKYIVNNLPTLTEEEKINKAIELYTDCFIFLGTVKEV
jgi:hypothetical protein